MVNFLTPPGLQGLFDLDSKGVDIKPTLLRVLTDQYLRNPTPSPEEEQRYTELATRLIDEVDIATRAAVSTRLAPHATAPRTIMLSLARDVLEVAEPVLLHSPCLTLDDCAAIVAERGAVYADILAKRGSVVVPAEPPARSQTVTAPPTASPPVITTTPPAETPAATEVEAIPATTVEAETSSHDDTDDAYELCELFFAAGSPERRLILLNLDFAPWPAPAPPLPLQRTDVWRMETAALRHNTATVVNELERALGISHRQSRRIVEDDQGEPIVAAAKAMNIPADVLQRILLFMNPRVGQSVDRVYELSGLYSEISVEAARRLVAILRAADPAERKARTDTRAFYSAMESAQRALSEIAPAKHSRPQRTTGTGGG